MATTIVDRLYEDFSALVAHLDAASVPSLRVTADESFRKSLLLAIASYFEVQVVNIIVEFMAESSGNSDLAVEFIRRKALNRQYHTLFNWDMNNANQFYSLFGERFKNFMFTRIQEDVTLGDSVTAFMEVGRERNRLVHQDFGTYTLEKTSEEIYSLYKRANIFASTLKALLIRCNGER